MENIGVKMIISLIRPIIIFSLTAIFAIASISCSTEGVSLEEFATLSTELAATQNQVQELKIQLADAEFKVSQYENTLREYTTIVDADYPNLINRVEQARLIIELITVSSAYDQGLATDLEMMSVMANVDKIDSAIVKTGLIQMMADGAIMSDDEAGELISSWLVEVHKLLQ
ncbi:MAG: hypothetical protein VX355_04145 [Chloroflexota bacterium]|jgi:hypothetical protein|tara:strand:- start:5694 stop:6209 length:516 start_codon:yes stop_codon:yes gene_type:complete